MPLYFIRLGALGEIHLADSAAEMRRGCRVIVRTPRGVELAEVVGPSSQPDRDVAHKILRPTSDEDEILIRRLERHKRTAIERCRQELKQAGCEATLLDVDQLFDGGTLVMHFLGPIDDVAESITQRIVADYESVVRSKHLAKLMHEGCGPGCGEKEGGCGSGGCSGCGVQSVCRTSRAS